MTARATSPIVAVAAAAAAAAPAAASYLSRLLKRDSPGVAGLGIAGLEIRADGRSSLCIYGMPKEWLLNSSYTHSHQHMNTPLHTQ